MTQATASWCEGLRASMRHMLTAVGTVSRCSLPHRSMHLLVDRMQSVHLNLLKALKPKSYDPEQACTRTRSSLKGFIEDFSTLLTALVPELDRFGTRLSLLTNSSIGTEEEIAFWVLWQFLVASCSAFSSVCTKVPEVWQLEQTLRVPLYYSFNSVLTWILSISHSTAWQAMTPEHGLASRKVELLLVLAQMVNCIPTLTSAPMPSGVCLSQLPPTFLPQLCCLMFKQFVHFPLLQPPAQSPPQAQAATYIHALINKPLGHISSRNLVCHLSVKIIKHSIRLELADQQGAEVSRNTSFLTAPSVLEFLRVMICLRPDRDADPISDWTANTIMCLIYLLGGSLRQTPDHLTIGLQNSHGRICSGHVGLSHTPLAPLSQRELEIDARLLHALQTHMARDQRLSIMCQDLQCIVLHNWQHRGFPSCSETLVIIARSLVGLATQCSSCALQQMHGLQERQARHTNQHIKSSCSEQRQPQLQHYATKLAWVEGLSLGRILLRFTSNFELHATGGPLHFITNPEFATLHTWCGMPGWVAAAEALHRGEHHADGANEVRNAVLISTAASMLLEDAPSTDKLQGLVSLAATARKLLWPYLKRTEPGPGMSGADSSARHTCASEEGSMRNPYAEKIYAKSVLDVLPSLADAVKHLDHVWAFSKGLEIKHNNSANSGCKLSDISSSGKTPEQASWCSSTNPYQDQAGASNGPQASACVMCHDSSRVFLLHQLQAITACTLLQFLPWRVSCQRPGDGFLTEDWVSNITEIRNQMCNSDVQAMITSMLGNQPVLQLMSQQEMSVAWERYAVVQLQGRLLPGCCNLGCANLGGFSEAALETKLCSGCNRARYCSVACQRAAWLEGGHRGVCGKQG